MSRPCVCGGSNENCRYCNGRGEIPDRLANALTAHSHLPESRKIHVGGKQPGKGMSVKPAGIWKWKARLAKLNQLRATIFGQRVPSPPLTTAPSARRLVLCPRGCGAQLSPHEVDRHIQQVHKSVPVRQQQPKNVLPDGSKSDYQVCPVCKVRVRGDRLSRHLRKVHKKRSQRTAAPAISPSASDVLRESTTLVAPRDKNLDATKLYAHSYRESGRFGSHPSHDGFDDESGPE